MKKPTTWEIIAEKLIRNFTGQNFTDILEKVNMIGELAEEMNHHPDLLIHSYKKLKIELTTHEAGELTEKDYVLANKIEEILTE